MVADDPDFREDDGMDFEAAGLLDGLDGEERAARLRLLEQLAGDGVGLDELKAAIDEDRLALVPVERVLGTHHTAAEIEARTGLPAELMLRIRRLTGLSRASAEDRVFADEDIAAAESTKVFLDAGFDEEGLSQITRVLGEAMSRLAATVTTSFAETFLKPGDSEEDVATRFSSLAEQLTPALTPVLVAAFKAHLRETVSRAMLGRAEREAGQITGAQEVVVCFADLVGFTMLGGQIDVQELGTVAGRFAELANDIASPPVRLVKTIGDAAMFVSQEVAPLVEAALSLVEAVEEAELPALRAGVANGPAQLRAGDFYGHSVNLASRVTGIARPGSVLCTDEVRDRAAEEFAWSSAGRHRLKGVAEPVVLYRARRIQDAASAQAPAADDAAGAARKRKADRRRKRASR
jgi:adenylate cyclase